MSFDPIAGPCKQAEELMYLLHWLRITILLLLLINATVLFAVIVVTAVVLRAPSFATLAMYTYALVHVLQYTTVQCEMLHLIMYTYAVVN